MLLLCKLRYTLIILILVNESSAWTNRQFRHFWPSDTWHNRWEEIRDVNCTKDRDELFANPHKGGYGIVGCFLNHTSERSKLQMAICSVILGLLPVALQFIGPKTIDISILAVQRPLLALFVAVGSPAVTLEHGRTGIEPIMKEGKEPLGRGLLAKAPTWVQACISLFEYFLVAGASWNATYLAYHLTFSAVAFVSTVTATFGNNPEAFSPLLWLFLPLPIHGICIVALLKCREHEPGPAGGVSEERGKPFISRQIVLLRRWIIKEVVPCAFTNHIYAPTAELRFTSSYLLLILNILLTIGVWVHLIFGIIVLSSIIFVSLFDGIEIVGRFLGGAFLCRMVLSFELYCLRQIAPLNESTEAVTSSSPAPDSPATIDTTSLSHASPVTSEVRRSTVGSNTRQRTTIA